MRLPSRYSLIPPGLIALVCLFNFAALSAQHSTTDVSYEKSAELDTIQDALRPVLEKLDAPPTVIRDSGELLIAYKARTYPAPNPMPDRIFFKIVYGDSKEGPFRLLPNKENDSFYEIAPSSGGFTLGIGIDSSDSQQLLCPTTIRLDRCITYFAKTRYLGPKKYLLWSYSYSDDTDPKIFLELKNILQTFGTAYPSTQPD